MVFLAFGKTEKRMKRGKLTEYGPGYPRDERCAPLTIFTNQHPPTRYFTDRILNDDLHRHLARLRYYPEAPIRTNSIILIGQLGPTLGHNTRRKVLGAAKALKDN